MAFTPTPSPFPRRSSPIGGVESPLPPGGDLPFPNQQTRTAPSLPPSKSPIGMATNPLAGQVQSFGQAMRHAFSGAASPTGGQTQGFGPKHSDFPPDINGDDIPSPDSTDNPDMPEVIDETPPVVPPDEPPAQGPPDPTRWLGGGPAAGGLSQQIQDKILELINQGPVDPNSEDIKNVVNAARVQERRQGDRARAFMAERRAASGLQGGGGFDTGVLGIEQGIGERLGGLSAGMVREAQTTRANQIMAALTLGQGRISAEMQDSLQRELAAIQAQLQREGMALQNSQFEAGLSQQALLALLAGAA
jgi:hypothetical protein